MIDSFIILVYFIGIILVGLWFGRHEKSLEDFSLGRRQIPWWAVLASIIAAETSATTFIGMPAEGYSLGNYTVLQIAFGMILGRLVAGKLFIQIFYQYQVYSIYEFLEIRFGKKTRKLASAIFLLTRVLASGTRLYVEAILLAVLLRLVLGRSLSNSEEIILYCGAIIGVTTLTTVYTMWGGIKAVIWTDLIQTGLMIVSAAFCAVLIYSHIPEGFRPDFLALKWIETGILPGKPLEDSLRNIWSYPYTIWAGIPSTTFLTLSTHGVDQDIVQRMLTARSVKDSRRSLLFSGLTYVPIIFAFLTIGLLLKIYFQVFPDPFLPVKTNEIFPYFILTRLPSGFRGLVISGLFATAMGSLSAALNALATSFTRDWGEYFHRRNEEKYGKLSAGSRELRFARIATVLFAIALSLVACFTAVIVIKKPMFRIIPIVMGIFGYTYGSLLGVFLLGILTQNRKNDRSGIIAIWVGIISVLLIGGVPGLFRGILLPDLAFSWRILIGTLITFLTGYLLDKLFSAHETIT